MSKILYLKFHCKRYSALCNINIQYAYIDNISDFQNIRRMFDTFFAYLRYMHKSVLMYAYIYKCTKIYYIPDSAFQFHALFQIFYIKYIFSQKGRKSFCSTGVMSLKIV